MLHFAWDQEQLDVLGEVLGAVEQLREQLGGLDEPTRGLLIALANRAATTWREPDAGMWEARDQRRQYVSSKVMCWVALDRAIRLAPLLGDGVALERYPQAFSHVGLINGGLARRSRERERYRSRLRP